MNTYYQYRYLQPKEIHFVYINYNGVTMTPIASSIELSTTYKLNGKPLTPTSQYSIDGRILTCSIPSNAYHPLNNCPY
jgi:hypothetical protein